MTTELNPGRDSQNYFWIAINGASCAMSSMPMFRPSVIPTPERLIGFRTWDEAKEAQQLCLNAPIEKVRDYFIGLRKDIRAGRVREIIPVKPEPPTQGPTMWLDGPPDEPERTAGLVRSVRRAARG